MSRSTVAWCFKWRANQLRRSGNIFSDISPQARETKEKRKQMGLNQSKMCLHSKGKHQQNKKTTH